MKYGRNTIEILSAEALIWSEYEERQPDQVNGLGGMQGEGFDTKKIIIRGLSESRDKTSASCITVQKKKAS